MKSLMLFSNLFLILLSCKHAPSKIVGNDMDKKGCKASAGYQWSEIKNDCIRSFELPLQIYNKDSSYRTGILFSNDSSRAEVFSIYGHFVLDKAGAGKYESMIKNHLSRLFLNDAGIWEWKY